MEQEHKQGAGTPSSERVAFFSEPQEPRLLGSPTHHNTVGGQIQQEDSDHSPACIQPGKLSLD